MSAHDRSWNEKPPRDVLESTVEALRRNGIEAEIVADGPAAKARVLSLLPPGAEVCTMTSQTLEETGIAAAVNESGTWAAVRTALFAMDPRTKGREQRRLAAAPDWALGSVHAVTRGGELLVASRTGSQLPAYAFGAGTVIWVVGAQKVVRDLDEGMRRVREYLVERESARAIRAYGLPADFRTDPNKVLIVSRETQAGRARVILVDAVLGI